MSPGEPSPVTIGPVTDHDTAALVTLINAAFRGYVGGDLHIDPSSFHRLVYRQQIDLSLSRVACGDGRLLGFAGVSRRGWNARLAIMGVHPDAAGRGVATRLTAALVEEAIGRGDRSFELEVIEQNPAAVRVYQKAGFRSRGRLVELRRPAATPPPFAGDAPEEDDIVLATRRVAAHGDEDVPWPLSAPNLATLGPPASAWRLGAAWAIGVVPADPAAEARLLAMVVPEAVRGLGHGGRLLAGLLAQHPRRSWHVPANCPESYAHFFERYGFERGTLSQFHMHRELG